MEYLPNIRPITDLRHCVTMGYESLKYGANTKNCDFRIFATKKGKEAWEAGRDKAKKEMGGK